MKYKSTNKYFQRIIFLSFFLFSFFDCDAAVWQWSVLIKKSKEHAREARAFLWIPENCKRIKGVVVAQNNMEEISILENSDFRRSMSKLGFAEIWVSPPFDHLFRFNEGAGDTFNQMVADLSGISGYEELKFAPVVALGHSAAASWPYYFAVWKPERTLAAISVSGQWPYFRSPVFAPDIWGDRQLNYVPCLETMGEYEAADTWSAEGLRERQQHPLMPLSMLACPAESHFAATDKKIKYIAFYIKKAVQYRLTNKVSQDGYPELKPIDPAKTGWLADKWRRDEKPAAKAAPVAKYKGDPAQAFWFFDRETAMATEKYEEAYRDKKAELLGFIQDGKVIQQRNTHQQVDLQFQPLSDGVSFKLQTTFLDTVPGESPRPANWTQQAAGSSVGHVHTNIPISVFPIWGPVKKTGTDTFILSLDQGLQAHPRTYQLWFVATHPGNYEYKPAIQQAEMLVPAKNQRGKEQKINFPDIPDQRENRSLVKLNARSDAGLKVYYYVEEGPAEVDGDILRFSKIPPRSRFPVKVTVVAWQYGRSSEPEIKTAEPVEQTFFIVK